MTTSQGVRWPAARDEQRKADTGNGPHGDRGRRTPVAQRDAGVGRVVEGQAAGEGPHRTGRKTGVVGLLDGGGQARGHAQDARGHEEVQEAVDVPGEKVGLAVIGLGEHQLGRGRAEVEVRPPERREQHEPEDADDPGPRRPGMVGGGHQRDHGFAEHDDDEQPDALDDVPGVQPAGEPAAARREQQRHLGRDEHGPHRVLPRCGHRRGGGPQQTGRQAVAQGSPARDALGFGVPGGRPPQSEQHQPGPGVPEGVDGAAVRVGLGYGARHDGDAEHGRQHEQPAAGAVVDEQVRRDQQVDPQPPGREVESEEDGEVAQVGVTVEPVRELGGEGDEDQVEEEFEPVGVAALALRCVLVRVAVRRLAVRARARLRCAHGSARVRAAAFAACFFVRHHGRAGRGRVTRRGGRLRDGDPVPIGFPGAGRSARRPGRAGNGGTDRPGPYVDGSPPTATWPTAPPRPRLRRGSVRWGRPARGCPGRRSAARSRCSRG